MCFFKEVAMRWGTFQESVKTLAIEASLVQGLLDEVSKNSFNENPKLSVLKKHTQGSLTV